MPDSKPFSLALAILFSSFSIAIADAPTDTARGDAPGADATTPARQAPQWPSLAAMREAAGWSPTPSDSTNTPSAATGTPPSSGVRTVRADTRPSPTATASTARDGQAGTALRGGSPAHPTPLPPRTRPDAKRSATQNDATRPMVTVAGSLAIVLATFLAVSWLARRAAPRGSGQLPHDVFETLGRAPLPGRQQLQLIRLGNKLVLLCISPTGVEPLAEVTEPEEVERLAALCRGSSSGQVGDAFRQVLSRYGGRESMSLFTDRRGPREQVADSGLDLESRYA